LQKLISKIIFDLKKLPMAEASTNLANIKAMPIDQFLEWQRARAWEVAKFHYDHNTFYRQKVGNVFPDRWEDLPVITKKDLQKPLHTIVTKSSLLKEYYIGSTSGSSGHPFYFAKDKFAHAMTWAVVKDRYAKYNVAIHDKQGRFYGIPKEFAAYWQERLKDALMNRTRFTVFDLSDTILSKYLYQFKTKKFSFIYGYTNSLVLFARYLKKNNVVLKDVCPTLKVCISTSEVCTPEDHILLESSFGIKNVREYGASETCLMAFDSPSGIWEMTEETVYNELVDANKEYVNYGDTGYILCTSLFNMAMPIIKYQVGDMAIFKERLPGSMYRSIDKLMGRTNDTAILPSGKVVPGFTFYYISRSILESSGVLKEFIVKQKALNHFVFEVVTDRELTETEMQDIRSRIESYLEPGLTLAIVRMEKINRPPSGKIKHFYSELSKS
jgi:phenylacetate-CoA ligase